MGFLNFLRNKFGKKENNIEEVQEGDMKVDTTVAEETPTIAVVEESEEEKTRKELLSKSYHRKYVFSGYYYRFIEVNGESIKYLHHEYFLADDWWPSTIKKVIKLTGDNLDGKPIPITGAFRSVTNNRSYYLPEFVYDGQKYTLSQTSIDVDNLKNHFITGIELAKRAQDLNNGNIDYALKKRAEQEQIDEMFKMFD